MAHLLLVLFVALVVVVWRPGASAVIAVATADVGAVRHVPALAIQLCVPLESGIVFGSWRVVGQARKEQAWSKCWHASPV